MEQWNELIGKDLKVIFEDGENHMSKKEGKLIVVTTTHLVIQTPNKMEGIALSKIIRFEVIQL